MTINQIWSINLESSFYIFGYTLKTKYRDLVICTYISHFWQLKTLKDTSFFNFYFIFIFWLNFDSEKTLELVSSWGKFWIFKKVFSHFFQKTWNLWQNSPYPKCSWKIGEIPHKKITALLHGILFLLNLLYSILLNTYSCNPVTNLYFLNH